MAPRFVARVRDGAGLSYIRVDLHPVAKPRREMPTIEAVMFPEAPTPVRYVTTLKHWASLDREMAEAAGAVARKLTMPSTLVMSFSDPGSLTRIFSFVSQAGRAPLSVVVERTASATPRPKANRASARRRRR